MTQTIVKTLEHYWTNRTLQRHSWARPPTNNNVKNTYDTINSRVKIANLIMSPAWTDNSS